MKQVALLCAGLTLVASASVQANIQPVQAQPERPQFVALMADYVHADTPMYGITIAPHHYDWDYANWGYYLGYAQSKRRKFEVNDLPHEEYNRQTRFGLSYSLSDSFSLYGGAVYFQNVNRNMAEVQPMIEGQDPIWDERTNNRWGAEAGVRYAFPFGLVLGLGYSSATKGALLSIGMH
ncbi:hypothetical protein [Paraferrimonas sedimenticola]|uniref:Uncharacterized protein n=1 Tax=Paraferrimonas sedimenticola TaxID=375674 RepID=A0AA37RUM8_9GAMM|nr:hypothetical protein [Paraferrimonas sedimenticola]GLP95466.1 hypothetical protein GCM10007895_07720 [Paraferrimonas sedimenticola]